jgi:hypothetical protein
LNDSVVKSAGICGQKDKGYQHMELWKIIFYVDIIPLGASSSILPWELN